MFLVQFLGFFMSFGNFEILGYGNDEGIVHPIRVQPETSEGLNDSLAPIVAGLPYFRRGGSRRKFGNFARYITLSTILGTGAATTPYASSRVYAKVTIFAKDVFDALAVGEEYTYQGVAFTIASKSPERVK